MKATIPFVSSLSAEDTARWQTALTDALPDFVIAPTSALSDADRQVATVAIVANPDPATLRQLPRLRWVQSLWAGVERLLAELPDPDVAIVRLVDPQLSDTMAESALTWALYLHRNGPQYHRQQQRRLWQPCEQPATQDRVIGVLGLGQLGQTTARRLQAHGFTVLGWSRRPKNVAGIATFAGDDGFVEILRASHIVVVLLPLTADTRGLLRTEQLGLLPAGASIINFGRGPIIDESALVAALDTGHLQHAVLDVFETEPLPRDHPFWHHPQITVLPHVAATTSIPTASRIVRDNIVRFHDSGEIPAAVDRLRGY